MVPFPQARLSAGQYLSHPQQMRSGFAGNSGIRVLLMLSVSRSRLVGSLRHRKVAPFSHPSVEEAAKMVNDRHAGLVVMNLHGSPTVGPRMGSVAYRMPPVSGVDACYPAETGMTQGGRSSEWIC
jgi:hypothetical protein